MMNYDIPFLLKLVQELGIEEALNKIDIELIDDIHVKIICRTIVGSNEALLNYLHDNALLGMEG